MGCRGPAENRDVRRDCFGDVAAPNAQVYIERAPELQRKELARMTRTWSDQLWPDNRAVMAIDILAEDSDAKHGETSSGAIAVGFATAGLAQTFFKRARAASASFTFPAPLSSRVLLPRTKGAATYRPSRWRGAALT